MLKASRCVQCSKEMEYGVKLDGNRTTPVCDNPECPCFGLVQMGVEAMQFAGKPGAKKPTKKSRKWVKAVKKNLGYPSSVFEGEK